MGCSCCRRVRALKDLFFSQAGRCKTWVEMSHLFLFFPFLKELTLRKEKLNSGQAFCSLLTKSYITACV